MDQELRKLLEESNINLDNKLIKDLLNQSLSVKDPKNVKDFDQFSDLAKILRKIPKKKLKKFQETLQQFKPKKIPKHNKNKIGRNDKCFCNSGKKYKKCCFNK